jgi:hypothetical protein
MHQASPAPALTRQGLAHDFNVARGIKSSRAVLNPGVAAAALTALTTFA